MQLTNLGKYAIEAHLGSGAFADVYLATDKSLKREVALKVLKPRLVADEEAFARFVQEAQVGASLFHANIATVLDLGEEDGYYYLAMRYVDGKSLDKVLQHEGPFSWERTCNVIKEIGSALAFAHSKRLVHRDIKPQNIIISSEGAVLTDFGLVKAYANSSMTTTGAYLGSPSYMAPEIWDGEEAGPASDQYAFACVVYEMLTGRILFDGNTPNNIMAKHFKELDLEKDWPENLPSRVSEPLSKALSEKPMDRFSDLSTFVDEMVAAERDDVPKPIEVVKDPTDEKSQEEKVEINQKNPAMIEWIKVPEGEFLFRGEKTKLFLPEFYIAKYPITNVQYKRFLDANPKYPCPIDWNLKTRSYLENHPVVDVSYLDAHKFCEWAGCRLPTEEEWEKAARGTDGRRYPWGNEWLSNTFCNSWEKGFRTTTPVNHYPSGISPYGVWDMLGNVNEWTSSREGKNFTVRGGSYLTGVWNLNISYRSFFSAEIVNRTIGFRCVSISGPGICCAS